VTASLDLGPLFAPEAQEVFTADCRVYLVGATVDVGAGAEGTYRGNLQGSLAVIDFDTPSGEPFRCSVPFDLVRSLYR
jgi:hypothetical protein